MNFTTKVTIANVAIKTKTSYEVQTMYTTGKVKKREFQKMLDDNINNYSDVMKLTCLDVTSKTITGNAEITQTLDNAIIEALTSEGIEASSFIENPND